MSFPNFLGEIGQEKNMASSGMSEVRSRKEGTRSGKHSAVEKIGAELASLDRFLEVSVGGRPITRTSTRMGRLEPTGSNSRS